MGMNIQKIIRAGAIQVAGLHPWKNNMHAMANKAMAILCGSSVGEEAKRSGRHVAPARSTQATPFSFGEGLVTASVSFRKRRSPK
jgi:hypothetical protein